jgi:hypothetical protein
VVQFRLLDTWQTDQYSRLLYANKANMMSKMAQPTCSDEVVWIIVTVITIHVMNLNVSRNSDITELAGMVIALENFRSHLLIRPVLFMGPGIITPMLSSLN